MTKRRLACEKKKKGTIDVSERRKRRRITVESTAGESKLCCWLTVKDGGGIGVSYLSWLRCISVLTIQHVLVYISYVLLLLHQEMLKSFQILGRRPR